MNKLYAVAALALALAFVPSTRASVSSQGFDSATLTQADASPTGNINTATLFALDDWRTNGNSTGIFAGIPAQDFGTVMLKLGTGAHLDFGNSTFGTFDSTSVIASSTGPGFLDVLVKGSFDPGSIFPSSPALTSEVRIALTQTPPNTGSISGSGTMSITPAPVPENSTWFLFLTGISAMVLGGLFRKKLSIASQKV